jgi:phosphoribosylanthranilate isomerase
MCALDRRDKRTKKIVMQIKVCGLRQNEDIAAIASIGVDYIGLIFYPPSARYAAGVTDPGMMDILVRSYPKLKRVGVFVDADEDEVRITAEKYQLNALQFHGDEDPEYCEQFMEKFEVIKAFSIGNKTDFGREENFNGACHRFLFDAKGALYGGNGTGWDWSMLYNYSGRTPFIVSGGIGPNDVNKLGGIRHALFTGIDINSRFEKYPGVKNVEAVKSFVTIIKAGKNELFSQ